MNGIMLDLDKPRTVRYGLKALSMAEKRLGRSIAALDIDKTSFHDLAIILFAGLWGEDNSLTVDKVMDLVDEYSTVGQAFDAVSRALEMAMSPPNEGDEKNA